MDEQLAFGENGNIMPCPYREDCMTYLIGCKGISFWCKSPKIKDKPKRSSKNDLVQIQEQ